MSEGKVGCSEKVHDDFGVGFHPCSRVGRVERDGKWYCSQHDPCYVKKRREQRQVENQQQLKHQRIYSQVDMDAALRRAKAEGKLEGMEEAAILVEAMPMATPYNTALSLRWVVKERREADARAAQIEEGE